MTKREWLPLLTLLIAAAAVLAGLNAAMAVVSHRLPYRLKLESIRTAHAPDLLFVGNSLLDHHLDEAALVQAARARGLRLTPLNAALGASEPPEQRLLFEYALRQHPQVTELVAGFYDFQLTAPDRSRLGDLKGNRMVGLDRRFPAQEVDAAYGFGARDRAGLALVRALPLAANRATAWKYVELLRRSMASVGMLKEATNSMGRVDDFAALESGSTAQFDAQAQAFLAAPRQFNSSYEAIFAEAGRRHIRVVLVAMPMSPFHLDRFYSRPLWGEYRNALERLAAARGMRVIDASRWLPSPGDFVDHLHMSQPAAHEFSLRLGAELPPELPAGGEPSAQIPIRAAH